MRLHDCPPPAHACRWQPVTHNVRPGRSIFVGSFARVDYENDERHHMLFTWFGVLPLHITSTRSAWPCRPRTRHAAPLR